MADFATVAELETFMGTSGLGARGTAMLADASAEIRAYTGQDIEVTTGRQESFAGDAWRDYIVLTQIPVTAVSAITINAVAFTGFTWERWGLVWKTAGGAWDTGPIVVTYDSGYGATSDEMAVVKTICKAVAARALGGNPETFGLEDYEVRGPTPAIFLTRNEEQRLDKLGAVTVG